MVDARRGAEPCYIVANLATRASSPTALVLYVNAMLVEWARRGKNNEALKPFDAALGLVEQPKPPMPPPWIAQVARPHAPPGVSTERPMQLELTDR